MIGYIKGTVEDLNTDSVVIDHNGMGFHIFTSGRVIGELTMHSDEVKLYTYMHVREDEISLFGFLSKEELNTFKLLLTVNGIGPKAALAILSVLSVSELTFAVASGDTKAITKANGIGAKGANRVIMELKDKLKIEDLTNDDASNNQSIGTFQVQNSDTISDTVLALVSLGYSESDALKAIRQVENANDLDSNELLKLALKKIF